ncbi:MAG: CocE/NonD family hydrolase [Deltaproteobacteria bacterium]|nr:CocE/NonD family hydrolase [Deltaproteobacteria bacterium]MBW1873117.1 CocE/NonD family hydrolase [Deltaproteobacteria bacterium]
MERFSRYITMRDGIRLAVDVYLPEGLPEGHKLPAILFQTRYLRAVDYRWPFCHFMGGRFDDMIEYLVRRGYAWVALDTRGSGASFGTRSYPYSADEIADGAELIDWIISQDWSSGVVGAWGNSYTGGSALMLMTNNHPALKAVMPRFAMFDFYAEGVFPGGLHLTWLTDTWGRLAAALDSNRLADFFGDRVNLAVRGIKPIDGPMGNRLLQRAVAGHHKNGDIRKLVKGIIHRDDYSLARQGVSVDTISPYTRLDALNASAAAVYLYTGWLDAAFLLSEIRLFLNLDDPATRLTIGPWDHGGWQNISPFAKDRDTGFQKNLEILRFFDHHLKGLPTGIEREQRVHYYTMGEERWKSADSWPPLGGTTQTLFLAGQGRLQTKAPTNTQGRDSYQVDFSASSGPHSRWRSLVNLEKRPVGYFDRAEADAKLLLYTSSPLSESLEVTGHPTVNLFVTSTAKDGAFFVYLEDVDIAGRVQYVTEGQLRALHRKLSEDAPPYKTVTTYRSFLKTDAAKLLPGEVTELVFALLPTSYQFKRGHSIRIAIACADDGHFAKVPKLAQGQPVTIELLRSGVHASRIHLPVMPNKVVTQTDPQKGVSK